jgi:hypothetical protein
MKNRCPVCKEDGLCLLGTENSYYNTIISKLGWNYVCEKCNVFYWGKEYTKFFNNGLFQAAYGSWDFRTRIIKYDKKETFMGGRVIIELPPDQNYIWNLSEKQFLYFIKLHELLQ